MSNLVFPAAIKGLTYTVDESLEFGPIIQGASNLSEVRIGQTVNPIHHWTFIYEFIYDTYNSPNNTMPFSPYTDLATMRGFYKARGGTVDDFLYSDADQNGVVLQPMQLLNDGGGNYYTPIQVNDGGEFFEDVTDLNGSLSLFANGVLQTAPTNYSLVGPGYSFPGFSFMGLVAKWVASPPAAPITATFNYYFRVRFETDRQSFEKFLNGLWTIGGSNSQNGTGTLKIKSSRVPAV